MRPDGLMQCKNSFVDVLMEKGSYTLNARTVFPTITLPCHMSMFHSVPPERHGTTTNLHIQQVRPINSLCEQLNNAGKVCAMYYGWQPIRAVSGPDSLKESSYTYSYSYSSDILNFLRFF